METPIRDAIQTFRENRPQRVAARRERIRDLLTPFSSDDSAPEPVSRIGKFLRSLGTGSSRQDLMPERKSIMMPEPRSPQTYANGPDVGADAMKRPYAGDATDNPAMALPSPAIQGGTDNLPAVPDSGGYPTVAGLQKQIYDMSQTMGGLQKDELRAAQTKMIALSSVLNNLKADQQYTDARGDATRDTAAKQQGELAVVGEKARVEGQLIRDKARFDESAAKAARDAVALPALTEQARTSALQAYETGNWPAFEAGVMATTLVPKDQGGMPLDKGVARRIAMAPIGQMAISLFRQHGGWAQVPPEDMDKLSRAFQYAYPVTSDEKGRIASVAEYQRIYRDMNQTMNLNSDPAVSKYLRAIAGRRVRNAGGIFTEEDLRDISSDSPPAPSVSDGNFLPSWWPRFDQ
jgi:hypothetical protein